MSLFRRRMASLSVLSLAAVLLLGGCASTDESAKLPPRGGDLTARFRPRWQTGIGLESASREKPQSLWRSGEGLYLSTTSGYLHSIDPRSGVLRWHVLVGSPISQIREPLELADKKSLLVVTAEKIFTLDRATGGVLKEQTLGFMVSTDPVLVENNVLVGTLRHGFHSLYLDLLGATKWYIRPDGDAFFAKPAISVGPNVILASRGGKIWKNSALDGTGGWMRQCPGGVTGGLATDNHLAFVAGMDGKLLAFDLLSGNLAWDTRFEGTLEQAPVPAGQYVLVVAKGSGLSAATVDRGEVKWNAPGVTQILTVTPERIMAVTQTQRLVSLLVDTGAVEAGFQVPSAIWAANTTGMTQYFVTPDGSLTALEMQK